MNRFARAFLLIAVLMQLAGCDGSFGGGPAAPVSRAEDPSLPAEVREYEAKNAKRLADQAEKQAARAKRGKSGTKKY